MKGLAAALALGLYLVPAAPAEAALVGRLDLSSPPSYGAWQALDGPEQALGISKRFWGLAKDDHPLLNVGIFAGASKPLLTNPGDSTRFLMGETIAVPGSTLDWALGTDWGQRWLPKLKTGILFAHDWTRPSLLHIKPDFIGAGITYPVGG